MPRIDILEQDLTRATGTAGTDIPFIPGFVKETQYSYRKAEALDDPAEIKYREPSSLERDNKSNRIKDGMVEITGDEKGTHVKYAITEYNKPILCTSIANFEAIFGKQPLTFAADETYVGVSVKKDDVDKSYIMAKELLNAGMPVYYYGVNPTEVGATVKIVKISSGGENKNIDSDITIGAAHDPYVVEFDKEYPAGCIIKLFIGDQLLSGTSSDYKSGTYELKAATSTITVDVDKDQVGKITAKSNLPHLECFYKNISEYFTNGDLEDKGEYTIKYLTTGGYPNYEVGEYALPTAMQSIASKRGECTAIIESIHDKDAKLSPTDSESFFKKLCEDPIFDVDGEFSTAFFPWAPYNLTKSYKNSSDKAISRAIMPACFGYLTDLAANIKVSPNWLAMAGTTRGLVPNIAGLDINTRLSNVVANAYQPTKLIDGKRALNAITDIKPYGLCIWGNRTLRTIEETGLKGTNFLNTRNMISDIKKVAYRVAKSLIYEQNNETLWLNFKSQVAPFLEQLKSGAGIADYKLLKLDTHYNGSSLGKEEFACAIRIIPVYAVETLEITVVVSDADVAVE